MEREFDAQIRRVGNSYIITIPSTIIKRFKLKQGTFLTTCITFSIKREFDAQIRRVGNSYVITIPSTIIRRFKLKQGTFITASININKNEKKN